MRPGLRAGALLAAVVSAACGGRSCGGRGGLPPEALPTPVKRGDGRVYRVLDKGAWKGFYDTQGRIAVVEYDSNADGRAGDIAHYDERRQIRLIEVDEDHDSWVDRFEHYDAAGILRGSAAGASSVAVPTSGRSARRTGGPPASSTTTTATACRNGRRR